jgi:hypothetical protein
MKLTRPTERPWATPSQYWPALQAATAELDPPYGVISLDAFAHNAFDMLDRAHGTPIRVASKSVRVRGIIDAVLALPGYAGVLAYTLPEANWLATASADGPATTTSWSPIPRPTARRCVGSARRLSSPGG